MEVDFMQKNLEPDLVWNHYAEFASEEWAVVEENDHLDIATIIEQPK